MCMHFDNRTFKMAIRHNRWQVGKEMMAMYAGEIECLRRS